MLKGSRIAVRPFELTDVEDYFAYAHLKQATLPAGMTPLKSQAAALEHIDDLPVKSRIWHWCIGSMLSATLASIRVIYRR